MIGWIFSLFGISTLASMTAMDVFASLLFLTFLFYFFRWKDQIAGHKVFYSIGWDFLFLLWIGAVGLSFVVNGDPDSNWLQRMVEFKWIVSFYTFIAAFVYLSPSEKVLNYVNVVLSLFSLYAISIFFIGFDPIKGHDFQMTPMAGGVRTGGLYSNPMTFAHAYGMYFSLLIGPWLFYVRWKLKGTLWLTGTLAVTATALILSFTRGAWIGMAGATLVMGFVFSKRVGVVMTGLGALLVLVLSMAWPGFQDRLTNAAQLENSYDSERIYIWKANLQMFTEHPIFGVGYGENTRLLPEYYKKIEAPEGLLVSHAHNQYLNFLSGTGSVGLLMYLVVLGYFLILSFRVYHGVSDKNYWHKGLALGAIGSQVCFILGGLTESNFEHAKIKYILSLTWALVVWLAYENRIIKKGF